MSLQASKRIIFHEPLVCMHLKTCFAYVVLVGNIVVLEYVFYDLPLRDLDYRTPSVGQIEKIWQVPRGLDRLATDPMP